MKHTRHFLPAPPANPQHVTHHTPHGPRAARTCRWQPAFPEGWDQAERPLWSLAVVEDWPAHEHPWWGPSDQDGCCSSGCQSAMPLCRLLREIIFFCFVKFVHKSIIFKSYFIRFYFIAFFKYAHHSNCMGNLQTDLVEKQSVIVMHNFKCIVN